MEYKDYYDIMGVKKDATQDEIKRSYRKLARKYHPDVSKEADAEAKFKEVGEPPMINWVRSGRRGRISIPHRAGMPVMNTATRAVVALTWVALAIFLKPCTAGGFTAPSANKGPAGGSRCAVTLTMPK